MSQVTSIQMVAGLQIFNESLTRSEFTRKFNKTYGTNHDEIDFALAFDEWEAVGAISELKGCEVEGEPLYMSIIDDFEQIMTSYIRKAMRVESAHTTAYWARH